MGHSPPPPPFVPHALQRRPPHRVLVRRCVVHAPGAAVPPYMQLVSEERMVHCPVAAPPLRSLVGPLFLNGVAVEGSWLQDEDSPPLPPGLALPFYPFARTVHTLKPGAAQS